MQSRSVSQKDSTKRAAQKIDTSRNPNAKPGVESIFLGPAAVTLLSAVVLITAMAFDRWYVTSYKGDISRIGLFKTCVGAQEDCDANAFENFVSVPSCRESGKTWQSRSIATAALIAAALLFIAGSLVVNITAALSRNMVYFGWAALTIWIGVVLLASGGGIQYQFFAVILFCDMPYCSFARERFGDNPSCSETYGMSPYLWFVSLAMLLANAVGMTVLCGLWRERLSLTWKMMNTSSSSPTGTAGAGGARGDAYRDDAIVAANAIPEGFVYSADYDPYYHSTLHNMLYDPGTSLFYDLDEERWIDPNNWS